MRGGARAPAGVDRGRRGRLRHLHRHLRRIRHEFPRAEDRRRRPAAADGGAPHGDAADEAGPRAEAARRAGPPARALRPVQRRSQRRQRHAKNQRNITKIRTEKQHHQSQLKPCSFFELVLFFILNMCKQRVSFSSLNVGTVLKNGWIYLNRLLQVTIIVFYTFSANKYVLNDSSISSCFLVIIFVRRSTHVYSLRGLVSYSYDQ